MNEKTIARFWRKVDRNGPVPEHIPHLGQCWAWTAGCDSHGYGQIYWRGRVRLAHRVSWDLHTGELPVACVLHACDNPKCVRPAHLFLGTRGDNVRDYIEKRLRPPGAHHAQASGERHGLRACPARAARGNRHGSRTKPESRKDTARLTPQMVREIRALCKERRLYQREIAALYGIKQAAVSAIVRRRSWAHVA